MFQGSRHVTKAEHFSLIQSAGGVNNATTYFDRTNYFETLPSHQLELALWLEADRMATLLDALDQENLDNQREVVKNEKRQTLRQPAVRLLLREADGGGLPGRASVPPHADRLDGGPQRRLARRRHLVLQARGTRPTTRCCRSSATSTRRRRTQPRRATSARSRQITTIRQPAAELDRAAHRRGDTRDRAGQRATDARPLRLPLPALRIARVRRARGRHADPAGGRGSPAVPPAGAREAASPRTSRRSACRWSTVRASSAAGSRSDRTATADACEEAYLDELERLTSEPVTDDELARARALIEAAELGALGRVEEVADRLSMYAALFDRPELVNEQLGRYLAVTAADIQAAASGVFRRRQPRGADLRSAGS